MHQRDLIKDQIELIGKVLGKIIADLFQTSGGLRMEEIQLSEENLKDELDIEVLKVLELDGMELKVYLTERHLATEHLEMLSDYFKEVGRAEKILENQNGVRKLKKAIELLELADEISESFSITRMNKKKEILSLAND